MELRYTRRDLSPIALAFYDRLREGSFTVSRCLACGSRAFVPREFCLMCGSRDWSLVVHPGSGTLHAFTTQELAMRFGAPEVIGLVDIDEGVGRGFGVIKAEFGQLQIGQRCVLDPVTVEDDWVLPAWRPA